MVDLRAQVIVAGFDYTYGPREIADMAHLSTYAKNRFEIVTVPEFLLAGEKVSSTRIRTDLKQGDVDHANLFLGYIYQTSGLVVHGAVVAHRFPTANILSDPKVRIPDRIYAVRIKIGSKWYLGMASVAQVTLVNIVQSR